MNRDLQKKIIWATIWKVTLNSSKSIAIISSRKYLCNSQALMFCGNYIGRFVRHKHLGLVLTSTLDWTEHINNISLRANRKLNVFESLWHLGRKTLDILYKLTVRSGLDYGLHMLYNYLTQQLKKRLSQIQYRASKLVSGGLHYTNQARLEAELGLESIQSKAEILGLSVFHKIH